jgi:WD40 repeat protein
MKKISKEKEKPEIYAVNKGKQGWELSRRSFISGAAAAASALMAAGAKKKAEADGTTPFPGFHCPQPSAHALTVSCLSFSSDGKHLFSGSGDHKVKVWDVSRKGLLKVLSLHTSSVTSVAASRNGTYFLTGGGDHKIIIWNAVNWTAIRKFTKHVIDIVGIGITPDSSRVVSADLNGNIKLWGLPGAGIIKAWSSGGGIHSMAISPNGNLVAVGHYGAISVWSLKTGEVGRLIVKCEDPFRWITELAFSKDSQVLVSGSTDATSLKLWSIPSGTLTKKINNANGGGVASLAASPTEPYMASGGEKGSVKIWNFPGGTPHNTLTIGGVNATSLAISPDGTMVATGQADGKIRLCKLLTPDHLGCLMDIEANPGNKSGIKYTVQENGKLLTITVPDCQCARPMPTGSVCVCNTVPGSCTCVGDFCSCVGYTCSCVSDYHYWYPN